MVLTDRRGLRACTGAALLWLFATAPLAADSPATVLPAGMHWIPTWGTAQQIPEPQNELPAEQWRDASLRQLVHVSIGGNVVRVRLSNAFGTTPLFVEAASVAKAVAPGKPDIEAGTAKALLFNGRGQVMIPAGAEYYSDALPFALAPGADIAISMHFKGEPNRQTSHPGSRTTSFVTKGNQVMAEAWPQVNKVVHWYQLSDVEVQAPKGVGVLVAMGDSITDGHGATTDGNNRWPDVLAERLRRDGPAMGVVNVGIGGGRVLRDGLGPNMAARWDRDVLARPGVTHVVVIIGVNDLGNLHRNGDDSPQTRQRMLDDIMLAHRQLVERAHAHGICVIGGTLTPYMGADYYRPNADNEADRLALNQWIRTSGVFDAVADFDVATRDAAQPSRFSKEADSGDGLHPSPAGFRAMAAAVPLDALKKRCGK